MTVRSSLLALAFGASLLTLPQAAMADDASKKELVIEVLELTGASDLGKQVADNMMGSMQNMPGLPPGFVEKFSELVKGEDLNDLIVPIYMKHYDEKTLKAAAKFYKSKQGRALISAMPSVTQESMMAGQKWGEQLAMKAMNELKAEMAAEEPAAEEPEAEEAVEE